MDVVGCGSLDGGVAVEEAVVVDLGVGIYGEEASGDEGGEGTEVVVGIEGGVCGIVEGKTVEGLEGG